MARNRIIKPDYWLDDEIAANFDPWGRLFYIGLWNHVEDCGIIPWNTTRLKAMIFPYDDLPDERLENYIIRLIEINKIIPYKISGRYYLWLRRFNEHQKIDRPSKSRHPLPPWINEKKQGRKIEIEIIEDKIPSDSALIQRVIDEYSASVRRVLSTKENVNVNENVNENVVVKEGDTDNDENPMKSIQNTFHKVNILYPSPFEIESLMDWMDRGVELGLINYAIEKAAAVGHRNLNYINSIIANLFRQGITTKTQALAAEEEFQKSKQSRRERANNKESPLNKDPTEYENVYS